MYAKGIVLAAALLAGAGAQAQLLGAPPPRLEAEPGGRFGPLADGFKRYQPLYGGNEAANPNDKLFPGFRTDPRLVLGYAFNRYLAIEAGYSHLNDEGFHRVNLHSPVEHAVATGALGAKSNTTYVAAKLTIPVNERLTAYGKLGIAQSVVKNDGFKTREMARTEAEAAASGKAPSPFASQADTGPYGAVGASYKLDGRTTLKGEVLMNGSAGKFSSGSNASRAQGSIGIGF